MDQDPMDRAWNFECFTFLKFENPSSGSKVKGHQSLVLLDPDLSKWAGSGSGSAFKNIFCVCNKNAMDISTLFWSI